MIFTLKALVIHLMLYSLCESKKDSKKQPKTRRSADNYGGNWDPGKGPIRKRPNMTIPEDEPTRWDPDDLPGFPWHQYNESRLDNLAAEAKVASEMNDTYGEKMILELHSRRVVASRRQAPVVEPKKKRAAKGGRKFMSLYFSYGYGMRWMTHYDPGSWAMMKFMARMMQAAVYLAQERLVAIEGPIRMHGHNFKFQLGYTFQVMKQFLFDIKTIATRLRRDEPRKSSGWLFFVYGKSIYTSSTGRHLVYYNYAYTKYVDITYMIEHICEKYQRYRFLRERGMPREKFNDMYG